MTKKQKMLTRIGILACCAVSLSYMGFSPILATIAEAFPDVDLSLVQMIMTIPNLMFIVFSPLAGVLMLHFRKKKLILISICLYIIGGLFPFFFHSGIWMLLFGSMLIGSGSGLMMPVIMGMIVEFFTLEERGTLMGLNATFVAAGALLFITASGILSQFGWHYCYLVFLLLIPILFLAAFTLPQGSVPARTEDGKTGGFEASPLVFLLFLVGFVYFLTQNAFNTNSSLAVVEYGIAGTGAASMLTLANTIGGLCGGTIFGKILSKAGDRILIVATVSSAIGFAIAGFCHILAPVAVGSVCVGFAFAVYSAGGTYVLSKYLREENSAFTLAIYNGFVNLGAALSPYFINGCTGPMGGTVAVKYIFSMVVLFVLSVVAAMGLKKFTPAR